MKSILITGASQGIGRATADLFLSKGWCVGLVARNAKKLNEMAVNQPNAVVLPADVNSPDAMQEAFREFSARAGRLDVLFNNAGMFGRAGTIDELSVDDFDEVMNVNVRGMFITAQLAFSQMRQQNPQGGRIINNGSISAHSPREGSISYTTSKHAITGMTKALSLDGRPFDIACCQIDIGNAETDMVAGLNEALVSQGKSALPTMPVDDAARSVMHMAEMPPETNVQFMTVMATKMPYIGRG